MRRTPEKSLRWVHVAKGLTGRSVAGHANPTLYLGGDNAIRTAVGCPGRASARQPGGRPPRARRFRRLAARVGRLAAQQAPKAPVDAGEELSIAPVPRDSDAATSQFELPGGAERIRGP